jgi:hypothetical protein
MTQRIPSTIIDTFSLDYEAGFRQTYLLDIDTTNLSL